MGGALRANRRGELSASLPPAPFAGLPPGSSPAAAAGSLAAFLAIAVGQLCEFAGRKLVERADAADGVVVVGGGGNGNGHNSNNPASSWSSPPSSSSPMARMPSQLGGYGYGDAAPSSLPLSSMFFKKNAPSPSPGSVELRSGGPSSSSSAAPTSAPLQMQAPSPRGGEPSPRIGATAAMPQMHQQQQQQQVSYFYEGQQPQSHGNHQQQQQLYCEGGGGYYSNTNGSGSFADVNLQ